jgi:putative ABC transport system permease protein
VQRLRPLLHSGVEVLTGAQLTSETIDEVTSQFLAFFRAFLLVFAGVALLVATLTVVNTFSILVAQRSAESALLRALGASRRQVFGAVLLEAGLAGTVASAAGVLGGLGVASLLKALFQLFGFALPASGLRLTVPSVALSLAAGVLVALLAGIAPAMAASRTSPLAALRTAVAERSAVTRRRALTGAGLAAVGVAVVLAAVQVGGTAALTLAGAGAAVTVAGIVVLAPVVARPASRLLAVPVSALRRMPGTLAGRNAMRNPRRTSATAVALMVGVAVVTLFTVVAASIRATTDVGVARSFGADLAISAPSFGGGGLSPRLAEDVARLPEVRGSVGVQRAPVLLDGVGTAVSASDPARLTELLDLGVEDGSVASLDDRQLAVSDSVAAEHRWTVGSAVQVGFADGAAERFTVGAVYSGQTSVGDYLLPRIALAGHVTQPVDTLVLIGLRPGVDLATGRSAVQQVAAGYGGPAVQDRSEYADALSSGVDTMLAVVYAMLALAVIIALLGIANALSLSVHERTRELGVLRALGLTRGQLRSTVRWESVIVAVFGSVVGLGLGVFLGWAMVRAAGEDSSFAAPLGRLAAVLAIGAVVGVLAATRPAGRAARLDVLAAIAAE